MLSEERIREAQINFSNYISDNLIKKQKVNPSIIDIYLKNSKDSLNIAINLLNNNKSNLWIITISYYSMFYMANAVLLNYGYKVGDKITHKVTADSLIYIIRNKLKQKLIEEYENAMNEASIEFKSDIIITNYDNERKKRNKIQYEMTDEIIRSKAQTSVKRAREFYTNILKLIITQNS